MPKGRRPVSRALALVDRQIDQRDKDTAKLMELRTLLAEMDASSGTPDVKRKKRKKNKKGKKRR